MAAYGKVRHVTNHHSEVTASWEVFKRCVTSERSPLRTWTFAMLSSQVRRSSGVLAYELARLYWRSTSISGSFSCSFICAVAIRTVLIRLVRSFTSAGNGVLCGNMCGYFKSGSKNETPLCIIIMDNRAVIYLEWCISVGEVIDDSKRLLKSRASNASICYQLAHCLNNLK